MSRVKHVSQDDTRILKILLDNSRVYRLWPSRMLKDEASLSTLPALHLGQPMSYSPSKQCALSILVTCAELKETKQQETVGAERRKARLKIGLPGTLVHHHHISDLTHLHYPKTPDLCQTGSEPKTAGMMPHQMPVDTGQRWLPCQHPFHIFHG